VKEEWPPKPGPFFFDARSELPEAYSTKHKTLDQKVSCGERPIKLLNRTRSPSLGLKTRAEWYAGTAGRYALDK